MHETCYHYNFLSVTPVVRLFCWMALKRRVLSTSEHKQNIQGQYMLECITVDLLFGTISALLVPTLSIIL